MGKNLWEELEAKSGGGSPSWGTKKGSSPSYRAPTAPSSSREAVVGRKTDPAKTATGDPTDRPYAYVQNRPDGTIEEWRPPTFWQIAADMGLRALEAALVGAFSELALYFTRRRFVPKHHWDRPQ